MCAEQRVTGKIQDNHLERQILSSAVVSNVYSQLSQGKDYQGTFTVKAKDGMFVGINAQGWLFLDIEKKLFSSASAVFRDGTEPRGQPPSSGPYKRIMNEPNSDEVVTDVEIDIMGQVHIPQEAEGASVIQDEEDSAIAPAAPTMQYVPRPLKFESFNFLETNAVQPLRPANMIHEHQRRDEDGTIDGDIYFIRDDDYDIGNRHVAAEELDYADAIVEIDEHGQVLRYVRVHDPGARTPLNPTPSRAAETGTGPHGPIPQETTEEYLQREETTSSPATS